MPPRPPPHTHTTKQCHGEFSLQVCPFVALSYCLVSYSRTMSQQRWLKTLAYNHVSIMQAYMHTGTLACTMLIGVVASGPAAFEKNLAMPSRPDPGEFCTAIQIRSGPVLHSMIQTLFGRMEPKQMQGVRSMIYNMA